MFHAAVPLATEIVPMGSPPAQPVLRLGDNAGPLSSLPGLCWKHASVLPPPLLQPGKVKQWSFLQVHVRMLQGVASALRLMMPYAGAPEMTMIGWRPMKTRNMGPNCSFQPP